MNLYKVEILVDGICKELCYVVSDNTNETKELIIKEYEPYNIIFKSILKIHCNLIVGD